MRYGERLQCGRLMRVGPGGAVRKPAFADPPMRGKNGDGEDSRTDPQPSSVEFRTERHPDEPPDGRPRTAGRQGVNGFTTGEGKQS
jgi:hypothetical protein